MSAQAEMLSPNEAAVIAGVSLTDVHRAIDERILPARLYQAKTSPTFKSQACIFLSFYFHSADRLTPEERFRTIALAGEPTFDWESAKNLVRDDFLTIDFAPFRKGVEERMRRLRAARELVVSDPQILSGTPVILGTRIPAYDLAAWRMRGIPMPEILDAYPGLTAEQVDLAALYAEANPQQGEPRQQRSIPASATLLCHERKQLSRHA